MISDFTNTAFLNLDFDKVVDGQVLNSCRKHEITVQTTKIKFLQNLGNSVINVKEFYCKRPTQSPFFLQPEIGVKRNDIS